MPRSAVTPGAAVGSSRRADAGSAGNVAQAAAPTGLRGISPADQISRPGGAVATLSGWRTAPATPEASGMTATLPPLVTPREAALGVPSVVSGVEVVDAGLHTIRVSAAEVSGSGLGARELLDAETGVWCRGGLTPGSEPSYILSVGSRGLAKTPEERKHQGVCGWSLTAARLVTGHDGLVPPSRAQGIGPTLRAKLEPARVRIRGPWELQRIDAAVDLRFADPSLGLAFLAWLGVCPARRWKQLRYGGRDRVGRSSSPAGRPRSARMTLGFAEGSGPPGRLIRLERRFRFTGRQGRALDGPWDWARAWLGGLDAKADVPQMLLGIHQAQLHVLKLEEGGALSGRHADGLLAGLSRLATGTISSGPRAAASRPGRRWMFSPH